MTSTPGAGDDLALGPGAEFDLIRELRAVWGTRARGLGDDAALLRVPAGEQLVASTDVSVEDVHFRADWLTPQEIGYRATTAALSDLAAMAASPLGVLIALAIPPGWRGRTAALAEGLGEAAARVGALIVGGDLSGSRELSIAVTVLGSVKDPLSRGGVRPGDVLWVTGALGGPGLALREWQAGRTPPADARARFARPEARIPQAQLLARSGAHAAIDISDGLLGDAQHLAAASNVRVELELDRLPAWPGVSALEAARSGEEYELLVAAPIEADLSALVRQLGVPITRVGRASSGPPGLDATLRGERVASPSGFDHFS
ncbi:MAG TPA: thiamine-phosphate kinase [Gemmatimonadaceae bacterium]|nr:thiamine-phosphate kinase [Gemmatimonadaceae bacterium]